MGQVLQLPDRGWKNAAARRPSGPPKPLDANNFYCTRCAGDRFLLYSCRSVQCADCGAKTVVGAGVVVCVGLTNMRTNRYTP